jgi:hypothetical protein
MKFSIITVLAIVVSVASFPVPSAPAPRAAGKKDSIGQKSKSCKKRPSKRSGTQLHRRMFDPNDGDDKQHFPVQHPKQDVESDDYQKAEIESRKQTEKPNPIDPISRYHNDATINQMELEKWNITSNGPKPKVQGGKLKNPMKPSTVEISEADGAKGIVARPDGKHFTGESRPLETSDQHTVRKESAMNDQLARWQEEVVAKGTSTGPRLPDTVHLVSDDELPGHKGEKGHEERKAFDEAFAKLPQRDQDAFNQAMQKASYNLVEKKRLRLWLKRRLRSFREVPVSEEEKAFAKLPQHYKDAFIQAMKKAGDNLVEKNRLMLKLKTRK